MKIFHYKNKYPPKVLPLRSPTLGYSLSRVEIKVNEMFLNLESTAIACRNMNYLSDLTLKFPPGEIDIRIVSEYSKDE